MTNKEKKDWLAVKYPLTVICDRYGGTYSGAMWLAFPLGCDDVPEDVDGEDSECMYFWKNYQEPVGRGRYASDAVKDLIEQMWISEPEYLSKRKVYDIMSKLSNLSQSELIPLDSKEFELINEITTDVRSLLDYPIEQKPAEWNEEDEDMLNSCISSIEEAKENRYAYKETDGDTSYDREIKWLKSLRPQHHWKPSEEQMEALLVTIGDEKERGSDVVKPLRSLYYDLKKL